MLPLREIDVLGVFVAPFAVCLLLAVAATYCVAARLGRIPAASRWASTPLFELTLFVAVLSSLVLLLGRI
ncbi:DUF1656 domain-containing protein [Methylobacterium sp. OAE515]|uniref:DUF1656 domain-containing protein n=1 Tax=Methylobacterium sp. OAE515 TaxID=2817895 RepID=UPI0035A01667